MKASIYIYEQGLCLNREMVKSLHWMTVLKADLAIFKSRHIKPRECIAPYKIILLLSSVVVFIISSSSSSSSLLVDDDDNHKIIL